MPPNCATILLCVSMVPDVGKDTKVELLCMRCLVLLGVIGIVGVQECVRVQGHGDGGSSVHDVLQESGYWYSGWAATPTQMVYCTSSRNVDCSPNMRLAAVMSI